MATWTAIADSVLEIGKPIRSIDHFALRDNVVAAFEKASGAPQLAPNYVVTAMIADAQISTAKIADGNVTSAKLAAGGGETAWVGARNVDIGANGVGSYVFAVKIDSGANTFGTTSAGSGLAPASVGTIPGSASSLSGTWRCMGIANGSGGDVSVTLWIRIA